MSKRTGILLINLGSPEAPNVESIRIFLKQFLLDQRVVTLPHWLWKPILKAIVLPLRSSRLVENYKKIWTTSGSPLISIGQQQAIKLKEAIGLEQVDVKFACCYGPYLIESICEEWLSTGFDQLIVIPLYPQYSETTTGVVGHRIGNILNPCQGGCAFKCKQPERCQRDRSKDPSSVSMIKTYAENKVYINMLSDSIHEHIAQHGHSERLVVSFHGLPKRCIERGDPYADQCRKTFDLLRAQLNDLKMQMAMTFQSRFGYDEWLLPSTEEVLTEYAQAGIKTVDVICPGFSADCLETLEEISLQLKAHFKEQGGEDLRYIPALNDSERGIQVLLNILEDFKF